MSDHRVIVSVRDFEQVKLLVYELQSLRDRLAKRGQPEAEDLSRILHRFVDTHLTDDRV